MDKLTKRQNEILGFIADTIDQEGIPPTRAEICEAFGFRSPNAAEAHLKALQNKGAIAINRGTSRGLVVLADAEGRSRPRWQLPLVGRVAAGSPILAQENIEDSYRLDPTLFSGRPDYLLRVVGESMINIGIQDGDLLAVQKDNTARNGQIVVARVDDEVTVKRFEKTRDRVLLHPENPDFQTIEVNPEHSDFAIEGLGVGVVRAQL